jgi:hypothetical protein
VPEELVESLLDNLTTRRLEIDMLEFSGIEFATWITASWRSSSCNRTQRRSQCWPNREVLQPSDVLHNKAVLVSAAVFVGHLRQSRHVPVRSVKFKQDPAVANKPILGLMELTMHLCRRQRLTAAISSRARNPPHVG